MNEGFRRRPFVIPILPLWEGRGSPSHAFFRPARKSAVMAPVPKWAPIRGGPIPPRPPVSPGRLEKVRAAKRQ